MNPQQYPAPGQPPAPQTPQGQPMPQPTPPQGPPAPQQPYNPGDPNNPYAFIMNNGNQPPKGKLNLPQGNSMLQRALIFGGGLLLLIIVGLMGLSLLSGGGGRNEQLISLAQEQIEIVRVADLARNERTIRDRNTSNLASNTSLSVGTSLQQTLGLIQGKPPGDKVLTLKRDSKVDALLTEAAANNQYDAAFTEALTGKLKAYQSNIKTLYTGTKSAKEKAVLESALNGTVILLGEHLQDQQ